MGGRGRGRGRGGAQGRGQGRSGGGGNQGPSNAEAATLDAINQAAREIKQILQQMPVSPPSASVNNRNKNARGSNSMMDLSGRHDSGPPSSGRGRGGGRGGGGGGRGGGGDGRRGGGGGGRGGGGGGRGGGGAGRGGGGGGQQQPCKEAPPFYYPSNAPYPNKPMYEQGNQPHYYPKQNQPPNYHHQNPQPSYPFPMNQGPDHQNWGTKTPPPSYDESVAYGNIAYPPSAPCLKPRPLMQNIPSEPHSGKKHNQPKATPQKVQDIVKTLARFDGQWATADMLAKQVEESEEEVVATVESRRDIFSYMRDGRNVRVELVPNIHLCSEYLSENGCYAKGTCTGLHLCKNFIMDRCNISACQFGHKFDTDHNTSVLSKLYLDLIDRKVLFSIIKKVCKGNAAPQLCSFYNTPNGCRKKEKCDHLHVCRDFVVSGGKCFDAACPYDHHFNSKQCRTLLIQHGISVNETQRDILHALKASMPGLESQSSGGGEGSRKDSSLGEKDSKAKGEEVSTKPKGNTEMRSGTVRSTDVHGDVEIPEICVFGINNKCYNEKKGCKYLHAKSMFHWQVQKKKKWYNLRIYQSKCLENAYRDVSAYEASIPPLDPNRVEGQDKVMLDVMGTDTWTADLNEMVIKKTSGQRLNIRRLSTASAAVSKVPQATVYGWFFKDEKGNWIQYGYIDSLGKQQHVCNITSDEIEKQYMQNPSTPMTISSAQYKYQLNFKQMTQTNLSTGKVREVRRRPTRLSYQRAAVSGGGEGSLPSHWLPMRSDQTHLLVQIDSGSQEYQDVVKNVLLTMPTATIHSIQRLQNQYLWHLMQYKKADLASSYNTQDMNIQKLFHGTSSDLVDGICKENIDFRKSHNKNHPYGKGTYFSNSCAIARTQGTPDTSGRSIVVLTEVIIGAVTKGTSLLCRPPANPITGNPYDTTVDDLQAPTIFVKYDKEEYYPEYVIQFY